MTPHPLSCRRSHAGTGLPLSDAIGDGIDRPCDDDLMGAGRGLARSFDATVVALIAMLAAGYLALIWLTLPALAPLPSFVIPLAVVPTLGLMIVGRVTGSQCPRPNTSAASVWTT
jgi:hypothetical protein